MLKTNTSPANTLLFTILDNSNIISSGSKNDRKMALFDFIKAIYKVKESSFLVLTLDKFLPN